MYKVFLNDRLIRIETPDNITINKPNTTFDETATPVFVKEWFQSFVRSSEKEVVVSHARPSFFLNLFRSAFINVPAAGGLVRSYNKILFIYRRGKWDLPKGKIDEGETAVEAALREVEEECGISGHSIVKKLPSTFHVYTSPYKNSFGKWIFKETVWFEMNYSGNSMGTPQAAEGIISLNWVAVDELESIYKQTYENLKEIISLYLP